MIAWAYLDKKEAAKKALGDYDTMQFIIETTDDQIKELSEKMESSGVAKYGVRTTGHREGAGEDKVIGLIDEIDTLKMRYEQAKEYMEWFAARGEQRTEEEQYLLETSILDKTSWMDICEHLGVEKDTYYKRRSRAIDKLAILLYGKI